MPKSTEKPRSLKQPRSLDKPRTLKEPRSLKRPQPNQTLKSETIDPTPKKGQELNRGYY